MHPPACRGDSQRAGARAFTLVELLAALAVVVILAGILFPSLGSARNSALKAKTRMRLNHWAAAVEQFRQEYGYYPVVGVEGRLATGADTAAFVRTLTGRNPDGSAVVDATELNGNLKRLALAAFGADDFFDPDSSSGGTPDFSGNELLCDAFGNTEIGVLVDRNGDGFVRPADDGPLAAVRKAGGGPELLPAEADLPAGGVRGGVLLYTAGLGTCTDDLVVSWK